VMSVEEAEKFLKKSVKIVTDKKEFYKKQNTN